MRSGANKRVRATIAALGLLAATAAPVVAGGKGYKSYHYGNHSMGGATIVVSCYRGPWREVIWDRPNGVFVDSLVSAGYDPGSASAIATRICRDRNLVRNPGALSRTVRQIYQSSPPRGRY